MKLIILSLLTFFKYKRKLYMEYQCCSEISLWLDQILMSQCNCNPYYQMKLNIPGHLMLLLWLVHHGVIWQTVKTLKLCFNSTEMQNNEKICTMKCFGHQIHQQNQRGPNRHFDICQCCRKCHQMQKF